MTDSNPTDQTIRVVTITPEDAKQLLETNFENNRGISNPRVAAYAADMTAGNWRLTGDPIRIDQDGKLIDGQHRLAAVLRSGVPLETVVVSGLEHDIVHLLDTGRGRSLADALRVTGHGSSAAGLAYSVPLVLAYEAYMADKIVRVKGDSRGGIERRSSDHRVPFRATLTGVVTRSQALALLERRPTLEKAVIATRAVSNHRRSQPVRPVAGVIAVLYDIAEHSYGGSSVIEFGEAVRAGVGQVTDPTYQLHGLLIRELLGKPADHIGYDLRVLLWFRAYAQWTGDIDKKNLKRSSGRSFPVIPGDVPWYLSAPPEPT